jgi:hypothetical protein
MREILRRDGLVFLEAQAGDVVPCPCLHIYRTTLKEFKEMHSTYLSTYKKWIGQLGYTFPIGKLLTKEDVSGGLTLIHFEDVPAEFGEVAP